MGQTATQSVTGIKVVSVSFSGNSQLWKPEEHIQWRRIHSVTTLPQASADADLENILSSTSQKVHFYDLVVLHWRTGLFSLEKRDLNCSKIWKQQKHNNSCFQPQCVDNKINTGKTTTESPNSQ